MLRINQCKLKLDQPIGDLKKVIAHKLKNTRSEFTYEIIKESIDAREKEIILSYTVDVSIEHEERYLKCKDVSLVKPVKPFEAKRKTFLHRPVIIGFGPAGMFAALTLAKAGCRPLIFERGSDVDTRSEEVEHFWKTGELNEESNVQFGEGGAGTFSDGKLTSRSKDERSVTVLKELVRFGADPKILYQAMPHIGTDVLRNVVKNLRQEVIRLGGEIHFNSKVSGFRIENKQIKAVFVQGKWIETEDVVLAIGHSARDTFHQLHEIGVYMEPKPFAVGVRIEHPQSLISEHQYGSYAHHPALPVASYRLTHQCEQRSVYSFCMCPGGCVVASTSQKGHLVTNGMSYAARDMENANSALLVQVFLEDVGSGLFDGMKFQEELEKKAFELGGSHYRAPAQLVGDFLKHQPSAEIKSVKPSYSNGVTLCDLHQCLPEFVTSALEEGIQAFDKKINGFAMNDAILTAVESRSTSPIRFSRSFETCQSLNTQNLYPCGEGAGYAGGIVSAAIDGIRVAEHILSNEEK